MTEPDFLSNLTIILVLALLAARVSLIFRIPSVIGFLLTGIIIGPSGAGIIQQEVVGSIAELGLVLLLFIIGLELSPQPLLRMGKSLLGAATIQVGATAVIAAAVILPFASVSPSSGFVIGVAVALSSTAIVLKQLSDQGDTDTLRGMIITGILLIQDILVIAIMLVLPILSAAAGEGWLFALLRGLAALLALAVVVIIARKLLPLFLKYVVRPGGKEFMTLFAVLMALGGAWIAGLAGWSLPLGACVAGLLLAESDLRHQLAAEILPFRDVFNALFFVSLGMLVHPAIIMAHPVILAVAIAATLALKAVAGATAIRLMRWPLHPALEAGIGLCTVSEFSYVLVQEAAKLNLVPANLADGFVIFALGTMVFGAMLGTASRPLALRIMTLLPKDRGAAEEDERAPEFAHHVIVVGYGINGQNVVRVLKSTNIAHCVIESNPRLAHMGVEAGAHVIIGDASRRNVLHHAAIETADALVAAINDPQATQRIVAQAKAIRPDLYVLARTHFEADLDSLYKLGADRVISEDFETSIEIAACILKEMDVPNNVVDAQIAAIRAGRYGMFRGKPAEREAVNELVRILQVTAIRTHYLNPESPACGKTLLELNLRARSGVNLISVVRQGDPIMNPQPDFKFAANDVLVLVGSHLQLEAAKAALEA